MNDETREDIQTQELDEIAEDSQQGQNPQVENRESVADEMSRILKETISDLEKTKEELVDTPVDPIQTEGNNDDTDVLPVQEEKEEAGPLESALMEIAGKKEGNLTPEMESFVKKVSKNLGSKLEEHKNEISLSLARQMLGDPDDESLNKAASHLLENQILKSANLSEEQRKAIKLAMYAEASKKPKADIPVRNPSSLKPPKKEPDADILSMLPHEAARYIRNKYGDFSN